MELLAKLANLKKKTMQGITEAAAAHDTKRVSKYSGLANRIEDDEHAITGAMKRITIYEKELSEPTNSTDLTEILDEIKTSRRHNIRNESSSSGRETGSLMRETFLDAGAARGYRLIPRGKTIFETGKGHRVAIPFANEQRPDRWFLGISNEKYDAVVLLCHGKDGTLFDFVVPRDFLEKFWESFSRSGGQVKLNVSRNGKTWWLVVPGYEPQAIGNFSGNYGPLRN
ncbi:MAG: hypothetical protein AAB433_11165 [Nitrospirota bacterium]|jgi:hypothetical protein